MKFNPLHYPTVFLSYDEPNADTNYNHLLTLCPNALRVHGVKGSDTAHKAIANLVSTKRVIIVDADNLVNPDFYTQTYELDDTDLENSVISFTSNNIVNGQQYGNGGIKCWPTSILKSMRTHENTDKSSTLVDFDFSNYRQFNYVASSLHINESPLQAWRAGFREGVKLLLDDGQYKRTIHDIDWRNFDRLWNWMHVGADVKNGLWAIHGARFGCWQAISNFDLNKLHDFDYLTSTFYEIHDLYKDRLLEECDRIGHLIRIASNDKRIQNVLTPKESEEYRDTVKPVLRCPDNKPYDIVFICYDELNADENFNNLMKRFPRAKRISGVNGIHHAHIEAAKLCSTDYFWVVDADAEIVGDFKFDYIVPFYDKLKVRVWRAKNPVNDLIYGYGGVKLLPRTSTIRMDLHNPDMTTSICDGYEPIMLISNITRFNTDPFNTWRSAFRECCKLSSETIKNQVSHETRDRLKIWLTTGIDKKFGNFCIDGANAGAEYGRKYKNKLDKLKAINNFSWIKEQYDRFYANTV